MGVGSPFQPVRRRSLPRRKFIAWATSKDYTKLVASEKKDGRTCRPARTSLYQDPEYLKVAPFAKLTLASIDAADPNKPTVQPVPYVGVQYAAIPEFQGIGTTVGQQFSRRTIRLIDRRRGARGGAIVHRTRNEAAPTISSSPTASIPAAISSRRAANWLHPFYLGPDGSPHHGVSFG